MRQKTNVVGTEGQHPVLVSTRHRRLRQYEYDNTVTEVQYIDAASNKTTKTDRWTAQHHHSKQQHQNDRRRQTTTNRTTIYLLLLRIIRRQQTKKHGENEMNYTRMHRRPIPLLLSLRLNCHAYRRNFADELVRNDTAPKEEKRRGARG